MEDKTRVSVKIYGQEYKISGEASREYILKLADYVDDKIVQMATNMKQYTTPMITVLAAVNIADEYYKEREKVSDLEKELEKLKIEVKNKNTFLDKAKGSYIQYKQEAEKYYKQIQGLKTQLTEKEESHEAILSELETLRNKNNHSAHETESLMQKLDDIEAKLSSSQNELEELKKINQELENNYFDTQMQNVQLKKELEDLLKKTE